MIDYSFFMKNHIETLSQQGIKILKMIWCDNAGLTRAKALSLINIDKTNVPVIGLTTAAQAMPATEDFVVEGAGVDAVGEIWLQPDWSTLYRDPNCSSQAFVMAYLITQNGYWSLCPRYFLVRMEQQILAEYGVRLKIGFEHEFCLRLADQTTPVDQNLYAAANVYTDFADFWEAALMALSMVGIDCLYLHGESAPGQFEISTKAHSPLQSADKAVYAKLILHAVAKAQGYNLTFLPKIDKRFAGSGMHLHWSLWRNNQTLGFDETAQYFMAGVLDHLKSLQAITMPIINSYERLQENSWSGVYQIWGIDNREAAIRVPSSLKSGIFTHFELKAIDGTCNPYLAIGALIACGMAGIAEQIPLPPAINYQPSQNNVLSRLAASLSESLECCTADQTLHKAMGADLHTAYLAVKNHENNACKNLSFEQQVALLFLRY